MESKKDWAEGVAWQGRKDSLQMGEGKKTTEPTFPSWSEPTLQIYFSILENNNPFIQPVWKHRSLIIDFRPGMESWEGVGSWKMGWGMGGGRGEAHKRESGSTGDGLMELKRLKASDTEGRCSALILPRNIPGPLPQQSPGRGWWW